MPKSGLNVALKGLDDIFSTEESRQEEQREQVQQIPVSELFPFKNHPFKVLDDDSMTRTVESISQFGVLAPLIARPRPEGGYEIISGHRRKHAAELANLDTVPVIVRNMEDDAATILMVDSNLQREHILPSERAFAYKMKLDAIKNQGARSDLTSSQVGTKLRADEILAQQAGSSRNQIQRYIRLTELIPELLDMVDEKKIALNPAYELSFLKKEEQVDLLDAMKHQGERVDLTCSQVGNKLEGKKSSEILAEQVGQSKNQIFRYIRLTELISELMDMVDEKKIALSPAYELSFLKKEEQVDLLDAMDSEQATPSLSQAQRLKKYSQEGHLTLDMMRVIMGEEKKSDLDRVTFTSDTLRKYFPKSYTPQRMQETIIKLLEQWQRKRQRDQER